MSERAFRIPQPLVPRLWGRRGPKKTRFRVPIKNHGSYGTWKSAQPSIRFKADFPACPADTWILQKQAGPIRNREFQPTSCHLGSVGDRIWLQEPFLPVGKHPDPGPVNSANVFYMADYFEDEHETLQQEAGEKIRSASQMSRLITRYWATIVDVHLERLQQITHAELKLEGFGGSSTLSEYAAMWDACSPSGTPRWQDNPWVWVLDFDSDPKSAALAIRQLHGERA